MRIRPHALTDAEWALVDESVQSQIVEGLVRYGLLAERVPHPYHSGLYGLGVTVSHQPITLVFNRDGGNIGIYLGIGEFDLILLTGMGLAASWKITQPSQPVGGAIEATRATSRHIPWNPADQEPIIWHPYYRLDNVGPVAKVPGYDRSLPFLVADVIAVVHRFAES